jgi:chemotaxis protein CheC
MNENSESVEPKKELNFEPDQMDALREVGNIAAAHAATALSKLVGENIMIDVTDCRILHVEELPSSLQNMDDEVAAIYVNVNEGEEDGTMLVMFPHDMALWLSSMLMRKVHDESRELDDNDRSALSEIGNIVACAYLNAISKFLTVTLIPTPPGLAIDMLMPILQFPACIIGERSDYAVVIETEFIRRDEAFYGILLFMPDSELLSSMVRRFGLTKISLDGL